MKKTTLTLSALIALGLTCASPKAAEIKADGNMIIMSGAIVPGDHQRFVHASAVADAPYMVMLSGPGGALGESLEIGRFIRANRMKTVAIGQCASGCAFVWMGGYRRGIDAKGLVIFHVATDRTGRVFGMANAVLGKYMGEMGASDSFIISALEGEVTVRFFGADDLDMIASGHGFYAFPLRNENEIRYFKDLPVG